MNPVRNRGLIINDVITKKRSKVLSSNATSREIFSYRCPISNGMKNLLIYISPDKKFSEECNILAKIQIDNSFELGWRKEDILLVTNFNYEYHDVKANVISGDTYYPLIPEATKVLTLAYLLEQGMVEKEHIYWLHDFDAYQMEIINESELNLGTKDIALTDYGWKNQLNTGSIFLRESSRDIFQLIKDLVYEHGNLDEEEVLALVSENNKNHFNSRYKRLNVTYNINTQDIPFNYKRADKPLKVIHFHPTDRREIVDAFISGRNELGFPLMTKRLIDLFKHHGIT
ncbi:MAG: hypothetical protein HW400_82 [Candidatus Levybacteria bacterium]|nr:hypothetical protein [Candidatus Levybacteria bacterium]